MMPRPLLSVHHRDALGGYYPFFDGDDVNDLVGAAGLGLLPNADREMIADALTEAFIRAAAHKEISSETTIVQRRKALHNIEETAAKLAAQLGIVATPLEWSGRPGTRRKHRLLIEPILNAANLYDRHNGPAKDGDYSKAAADALDRLPEVISALQLVCAWAKDNVPQTPFDRDGAGGDTSAEGQDSLFVGLAEVFFAMFGRAPDTGWLKADPKKDSLLWINAVLELAKDRISDRILLDLPEPERAARCGESAVVQVVNYAFKLEHSSRAKRLADAWGIWRSLDFESQWSSEAWMTGRLEAGSRVPGWMRSIAVPVPNKKPRQ
jgi:hypothetical protein